MPKTIATLIYEFLAPVQPDECRHVNLQVLAHALKVSGPVIHGGMIVSSHVEGEEVDVDFDLTRAVKEFATTNTTRDGFEVADLAKIPPDSDLAKLWGLPLAADTPLMTPAALAPSVSPPTLT